MPIIKTEGEWMRILIVDDSEDTGILVAKCLSPYEVVQALSVQAALDLLDKSQFNLLLIDVTLPDGDGFSFCDRLARDPRFDQIPKFFLSGRAETSDKVFGLNCGADDYITKPFELSELKARVDSRLRLQKAMSPSVTRLHDLEFESDFQRCFCVIGETKLDLNLTPTEYQILLALAKAEPKPLSRREIVRAVWSANGLNIEMRGVDSHIAHLRKKLAVCDADIISVYGKGYALKVLAQSRQAA